MKRGLVSVVVPTYNRAYCLTRSVDSALSQTHRQIEVVIVDDGSTDGTDQVVASRYSADKRVRYIRQENAGVAVARNTGLREAQGDYVALLDSDDVWKPWKAELQVRCLRSNPELGMIWTDMEAVSPDGEITDTRYLRQMYSAYTQIGEGELFSTSSPIVKIWPDSPQSCAAALLQSGDIYSYMILGNLVHTSTVLLTRERLEAVGRFRDDWRIGEDYDFHLRTCRQGKVAFADVSSIYYQTGMADRLTRPEYSIRLAQNFLKTIEAAIERDRARITLPQSKINSTIAYGNAWLGDMLQREGDPAARAVLWRSIRMRFRLRTAALLLMACAPAPVAPALRTAYRTLKGSLYSSEFAALTLYAAEYE
jgi:GT2 family glycosyltransferase